MTFGMQLSCTLTRPKFYRILKFARETLAMTEESGEQLFLMLGQGGDDLAVIEKLMGLYTVKKMGLNEMHVVSRPLWKATGICI